MAPKNAKLDLTVIEQFAALAQYVKTHWSRDENQKQALAKKAGVSPGQISRLLSGDQMMEFPTVAMIAAACGQSLVPRPWSPDQMPLRSEWPKYVVQPDRVVAAYRRRVPALGEPPPQTPRPPRKQKKADEAE